MPPLDPNQYQHDVIAGFLSGMTAELVAGENTNETIDKYALKLNAFMRGQISNAVAAMME